MYAHGDIPSAWYYTRRTHCKKFISYWNCNKHLRLVTVTYLAIFRQTDSIFHQIDFNTYKFLPILITYRSGRPATIKEYQKYTLGTTLLCPATRWDVLQRLLQWRDFRKLLCQFFSAVFYKYTYTLYHIKSPTSSSTNHSSTSSSWSPTCTTNPTNQFVIHYFTLQSINKYTLGSTDISGHSKPANKGKFLTLREHLRKSKSI